jgi:hypothetical protein
MLHFGQQTSEPRNGHETLHCRPNIRWQLDMTLSRDSRNQNVKCMHACKCAHHSMSAHEDSLPKKQIQYALLFLANAAVQDS